MAKRKGLYWRLSLRVGTGAWWKPIIPDVAKLLRGLPFWSELTKVEGTDGEVPMSPAAFDQVLRSDARTARARSDDQDLMVSWSHRSSLVVDVTAQGARWRSHAAALPSLFWPFVAAFPDGIVEPESGIQPDFDPDLPWKQIANRPTEPALRYEHVVAVVDQRITTLWPDDEERAPIMKRLAAAAPADAKVERRGPIALLQFTDKLTDEGALADARQRHERWLVEIVDPKRSKKR